MRPGNSTAGVKLVAHADVGRAGLGNMLMPWARARVWSWKNQSEMLAPNWFTFRIGPYIRGELDKRNYHRLFHSQGYVTGVRKLLILLVWPRIDGDQHSAAECRQGLVVFKGLDNTFPRLKGYHAELKSEILRITRRSKRPGNGSDRPFVAIHCRLGDFQVAVSEEDISNGTFNLRQPMDWYVRAIEQIRRLLGSSVPVVCFSDGRVEELQELLSIPGVEMAPRKNAVADLFRMSEASLLVASGSTFSMWASFLGQMPTIWHPGQYRLPLVERLDDERLVEIEWSEGSFPSRFETSIKARLEGGVSGAKVAL